MNYNTDLVTCMLTGQAPMPQGSALEQLIRELKAGLAFGKARKLLIMIPRSSRSTWSVQQLALCTYKDEDLPTNQRLANALQSLTPEQLSKVVDADRGRTLRYMILHGLHDEANHQGEIWLLKKLRASGK